MWPLRPLPLLAVVVALCLGVAAAVSRYGGADPVPQTASRPHRPAVDDRPVRALDVLAAWDRSRAAAYSSGDVAALRRLYVPGAPAGRRDARVLREYVARGLSVEGLDLQRSEVDLVVATDRRVEVEVVERLAGGVVTAGDVEMALPADRPERREVTLVNGPHGWQVASVVPVRRPARPG
jgi:hypothetical protein